ncbi:MAG: Spy0128 family protein [Bilifractor sp.]|jgi:pilin isopeptide linkage protein
MKNKNTFRKWMALFLSISMVAASGITSNVRLRAAEDTPVQETTAEGTTNEDANASASENAGETTVSNVEQNDTTRTEEIGLNGTEQAAEESAAPAEGESTEAAADAEQAAAPETASGSENKETAADSTASSSVSSSSEKKDQNLTASEQIDEARKDATKREYSYEDDLVSVTATLDDAKAVPDNAEFRVTPVTKDSTDYNYDAYMKALNDDAEASSDSDTEKQYTDENTLLYDMAFIYPVEEKDENGNVTQKEVEVQPAEGAVKISVNFKKDQLTNNLDADKDSDVEIKHLPLTEAVKESTDTTADATNISAADVKVEDVKSADVSVGGQTAEFNADSFSVFAFKNSNGKLVLTAYQDNVTEKSVLGDAWYYGITADEWDFDGESETNFAVKKIATQGGQTGLSSDKVTGSNSGVSILGSTTNSFRIKGFPEVITCTENAKKLLSHESGDGYLKFNIISSDAVNNKIGSMIKHVSDQSIALASHQSSDQDYKVHAETNPGSMDTDLDITGVGSGTIYIDPDKLMVDQIQNGVVQQTFSLADAFEQSGKVTIRKRPDQVLVLNFYGTGARTISNYKISNSTDPNAEPVVTDSLNGISTNLNDTYEGIIFNFPESRNVTLYGTGGIFLVPTEGSNVTTGNGNCGGWIVARNITTKSEWHFTNGKLPDVFNESSVALQAVKQINGLSENVPDGFSFKLEEKQSDGSWRVIQTKQNEGSSIAFDKLTFHNKAQKETTTENHIYRISECADNGNSKVTVKGVTYNIDPIVYYGKVGVVYDKHSNSDNSNTWSANATLEGYYTDENCTKLYSGTAPVFNNTSESLGSLSINKKVEGTNAVDKEFTFEIALSKNDSPVSGNYTIEKNGQTSQITFNENGTATVKLKANETLTLSGLPAGIHYVVTEKNLPNGYSQNKIENGEGDITANSVARVSCVNTYKAKSTSVTLGGLKTVNGINNSDKTFSFTLSEGDTVLQTVTRTGAGEYKFDPITYEETGDHTYTVAETEGNAAGYTYDTRTYTVKVSVTDDKSGHLHAKISGDTTTGTDLNFTNTYKAKETSVTFSGTKTLTGKDLVDGEFSFDLKDSKGNVLQTVQNGKDRKISFKPISYTAAGQYTYTISEEVTQESGVTADGTVYNVTVDVTDDGSGQLKAAVTGLNQDGSGADFTNTYKADSTSVTLGGFKTVNGINNSDKTFSFTLSEGDTVLQTVTRTGAGEYKFDPITYEETGDHTYTVAETEGNAAGYTYDTRTYTVKVSVTDDKSGHLHAKISGDTKNGTDLDFTNTYQAKAASAVISGTKTLNGVKASVAGQFRFDLFDANGNRIDTAANDENGNFIFGKLHFEKAGDYTYTIKEQNAGKTIQGIKYQDKPQNVTIHVGDNGDGVLKAEVENGSISFNNTQYGSIKISKDWDDEGNESYRPSSVVIDLIDTTTGAVVKKLELSEVNGWSMSYDQLEAGKSYTVHEEENDEYYKAENNDQVVTADVNGKLVTLTNKLIHPNVTIYANKVLNGGTLTNGEFTFALYRNSDPDKVYRTAANTASGEIFFTDVEYDEKGYTVREIQGSDPSVAYDSSAIVFDAEGNVTSTSHAVLTNTVRPIVLRVQKRSRTAPYDPLPGATYGLYEVVEGGNDILIESQVSDENGYMYFGKIQPSTDGETHIYYFKEIAAPEGHEVDPYVGQKFQVRYTGNGEIALYSADGTTPVTIGDITSQNSENLLVQHTSAKTSLDTAGALTYSDSKITATAQAVKGAFEAGTTMKVVPLTGSDLKDAQNKVEIACGKIANNVAYYNVEFINAKGAVVEPACGDVTVTIQYKDSLKLPEGTDAKALKIVHLKEQTDGTEVQAVAGTIASKSGELLQASFTSDSFSKFGIVEPSADNSSLNSNYLVTAAGVSDQVSRLNIAKLDTSGKYLKGARLQIIDKATGNVMADWTTTDGPETFARWFDEAQTKSMNVDTYYILHEVSAPEGYQLADDILFKINKYDSSITIYKLDANGNLVVDQEAIDKWVSDHTLDMIDVPVEYQTKKVRMQKTVKYEKLIQGKDKVVYVTNAKAVKTGDVSNIAMYAILLAAAAAVLIILFRARREGNRKAHKN